jgi:hypothetical protein
VRGETSIVDGYTPDSESTFVRRLPLIFALANFAVSFPLLVWEVVRIAKGVSLLGDRVDAQFLLVYLIDLPSSFLASAWLDTLFQYWKSYSPTGQGIVVSAFLLFCGTAWYYFVGMLLRRLIRKRRQKRLKPGFPIIPIQK